MAQQPPNFGDTSISTTITPGSTVVNPVQNDSGKYIAKAVDAGAQGIGQIAGDVFQLMNAGNSAKITNDYRQKLLQIADAQSQGIINMTTAGTRARLVYAQATAANPALADQIDKINSSVLGDTGLGHVIIAGTPQDQAQNDLTKGAIKDGYVDKNGNADVVTYQAVQHQSAATAATLQQIDLQSKQLGYVTDVQKAQVHQSITQLATVASPWVYQQIDNTKAALAKTTDPTHRAQLIGQLQAATNAQFVNWSQEGAGIEGTDWLVKPLQDAVNIAVDGFTGKTEQTVADAQIAAVKAKASMSLLQDSPDMAKLVAASALLGQAGGPILEQQGATIAARIFAQNSQLYDTTPGATNPSPADVLNSDINTQKNFKILDGALKNGAASSDPQVQTEVNSQLTNLMRSVGKGSNSPTDFTSVINFFASPNVATWIKNGKTIVPNDIKALAIQTVSDDYQKAIIPAVINRWDERSAVVMTSGGANPVPMGGSTSSPTVERHAVNELVDPVWDGNNLSFKAKPQYTNNASVVGLVRQLNTGDRSLALPINNLIKATAHMNGDTDYTKIWQRLAPQLFQSALGPDGKSDIGTFEPPKDTTGEDSAKAIVKAATPVQGSNDLGIVNATAGMKNNNPGNIKFDSRNNWQGQAGPSENTDQGTPQVVFNDTQSGMRATAKLVLSKFHAGSETINDLIAGSNGWTPGYVLGAEGVAKAAGIGVNDKVNMQDPSILARIIRGIVTQEHGPASKAYTDDMIKSGIKAALGV